MSAVWLLHLYDDYMAGPYKGIHIIQCIVIALHGPWILATVVVSGPEIRHWTYPFFEDIISYPLSRPKK
jgi:hypothetical protein